MFFDMDGVIFKDMNFWMSLHKEFGTLEKGKQLTDKYLLTDYNRLVKEVVVKLWKGKSAKPYYDLVNSAEYLQGVEKLFKYIKTKGLITAIITGGSIDVARRAQKDFGIDHIFANELVIKDNKVAGEFVWPIGAGNEKKAEIIRTLCFNLNISLKDCIYIGDQDTDLEAFKIVGLSIAFNSNSDKLKKTASFIVDSQDLSGIISILKKELE